MIAATDCDLRLAEPRWLPSWLRLHVLLLPDYGVGIFALANRTYAGPQPPVWDAAVAMLRAGDLTARPAPVSPALSTAYVAVVNVFSGGTPAAGGDVLSMNFLMDRDATGRATSRVSRRSTCAGRPSRPQACCRHHRPARPAGSRSVLRLTPPRISR
jgi:hypothetical protein